MSTSVPQIPPRPNKSQEQGAQKSSGSSLGVGSIPQIPPRPNKRTDRSVSPSRESFARSPLNDMPSPNQSKLSIYKMDSANNSTSDLPPRPASVVLPSIGQEGSEYAEVFGNGEEDLGTSPTQTRNVANDLQLHAPKPSHPESSAKLRVSTVTRTDSSQAAAYGIGKASDDKDPSSRSLKTKSSFASNASAGIERPPSSNENDHGIPEIGQRVPMYPNAGDVQAPSPSPYSTPYSAGVGFHNDGSKPRHHERKTSGRGGEVPPGSYGLHGHGIIPHDRFEKAYYEKHPELYKRETTSYHGPLGEGRAEWAMSSDDLNRIVRDTASRGAGLGTSREVLSTPTEQIGFQASEEYASRMSSPRPQSSGPNSAGYNVAHSNTSQTHFDSPLRKESFPPDGSQKDEIEGALSKVLSSDSALESEVEGEDTIHVDPPSRRSSRVKGDSADDTRPHSAVGREDGELLEEHGYNAPILASDEVAKEPFGYELQPAVSPTQERRHYEENTGYYSSTPGSRATSRPGSIHNNISGVRHPDPEPLEGVQEYEPLFPEDEKTGSVEKPLTAADRLKRPEGKNRRFPSQDVWEDTPNSLQYTATVSTPQLPDDSEDNIKGTEETPEQAFARRQEELAAKEFSDKESFLHAEKKAWSNKSHLAAETRPGALKQRFPSRDIWEDTPDSLQLQTTVSTPQQSDQDVPSPHDEKSTTGVPATTKPAIPARPAKSKREESPDKAQPAIPDRPQQSKQVPSADHASSPQTTKPKPQIPARPTKPIARASSENIPLTTVPSNSSAKSTGSDQGAAAVKAKPPVPSRPVGSKIAALQGGFLSDLNARLKLGPQAPKKEEPKPEEKEEEKEKVPLSDARKGRARGPARRAPARSPAPVTASAPVPTSSPATLVASTPSTTWYIDSDEVLHVDSKSEEVGASESKATQSPTPTLATNTAGESLHDSVEIAPAAEKAASPPSASEDLRAEQVEESQKEAVIASASSNDSEPSKTSDVPPVVGDNPSSEDTLASKLAPADSTESKNDEVETKHVE